ncbi:hypothetical protein FGB62_16g023 [Gracilaria domingensis]|nr:hypothetical protein FGB62_16g023 [Gracilaria domingensis]
MTDRLGELHEGAPSASDDIEAVVYTAAEANLAAFNREADVVERLILQADRSIRIVTDDIYDTDVARLDTIHNNLDAARKHLQRIADDNRQVAARTDSSLAILKHRVNRFTQLSKDFMGVIAQIETVRELHLDAVTDGDKRDILAANRRATETLVESEFQGGDLQAVLHEDEVHLRDQSEDLRAGNQDTQYEIKDNVKQAHQTKKKAVEDLEMARNAQKAAIEKKWCYIISVIVILLATAAGIIVWQGLKNDWFGGGIENNLSKSARRLFEPRAATGRPAL